MAVIAIIQQKGGVGKSTITANLAAELVHMRRTVAILDLDPQQSLTAWSQMGEGILKGIVRPVQIGKPQAFKAAVEAACKGADRVLLDSPPGLPDSGMMAALLSDIALLPVTPSPLDLLAAKQAVDLLREAQSQRKNGKPEIAFVPSKVIQSTVLGRDIGKSLKSLGEAVLPGITQRIAIAEAVLEGFTVREYAPGSEAVEEFRNLAQAVERMVKR